MDSTWTPENLLDCLADLTAGEASRFLASAEIVDNVPTMPYFPLWEAWAEHVDHCSQCAFVIHETEDQLRDALCWEGQTLNIGISKEVTRTASAATLN